MPRTLTSGSGEARNNPDVGTTSYDHLYSDGTEGQSSREMYMWVYPNTGAEGDECSKGSDLTQEGLRTACAQILADSSVTYYEIRKFPITTYGAPNLNDLADFNSWLQNNNGFNNGTGEDLKNRCGVHLLVHGKQCTQANAGGEFADTCDGTAFDRGVVMWTPANCENEFREASAIQEAIHPFISFNNDDVKKLFNASMNSEHNATLEHAFGEVRNDTVTPMLTYHLDDGIRDTGDCDGDSTSTTFYGQDLTSCTIDAVGITAEQSC